MQGSEGKLFLADQRGLNESAVLKRYSTFNFENFYNRHKDPFHHLYVFNDEWLGGSKSFKIRAQRQSFLVIIPITGDLILKSTGGRVKTIGVEQVHCCAVFESSIIELVNPYKNEAVNYLQFWLSHPYPLVKDFTTHDEFDLVAAPDQLIRLFAEAGKYLPFKVSIGRFLGRKEAIYVMKSAKSKLFVFVISGVFEVEGRLLHERDGLALWNTPTAELEALSNNAVILVAELLG